MAKIGIRKIKIAKKGEVSDSFFDSSGLVVQPYNKFTEINFVQDSAALSDETVDDENGTYHVVSLDFVTRSDFDEWRPLIRTYIEIPVVILVESIDGCNYVIGTNKAPAYITVNNSYKKIDSREIHTTCNYRNKYGLLEVKFKLNPSVPEAPFEEYIIIDQNIVKTSWQGGANVIYVKFSYKDWQIQTISNT